MTIGYIVCATWNDDNRLTHTLDAGIITNIEQPELTHSLEKLVRGERWGDVMNSPPAIPDRQCCPALFFPARLGGWDLRDERRQSLTAGRFAAPAS